MKKYPSLDDIVKMKERGDDPALIREAEKRLKRRYQAQILIAHVRKAFAKVRLGNGVGLWQAQGLDDYASKERCAQYRAKDEKEDWSRISANDLNYCNSSLSFVDAEGMRFLLPAYLVSELEGTYGFGMDSRLNPIDDYSIQQYALLKNEQRRIVRDVVLYLAGDEDYKYQRKKLLKVAHQYWSCPCSSK